MDSEEKNARREQRQEKTNVRLDYSEKLLLSDIEAAWMCGIGRTLWLEMKVTGKTPAPIRLGRRILWRRADIKLWVSLGCPNRERFDAHKKIAAN